MIFRLKLPARTWPALVYPPVVFINYDDTVIRRAATFACVESCLSVRRLKSCHGVLKVFLFLGRFNGPGGLERGDKMGYFVI